MQVEPLNLPGVSETVRRRYLSHLTRIGVRRNWMRAGERIPSRDDRRNVILSGLGGIGVLLTGCAGAPGDRRELDSESGRTFERADRDTRIIAHRGCADQYPENTILAVEQSAPHVDMIEIDIQRCASGELVVFHDDELDRLTEATGAVSTTDWEKIRELTVLDSGESIPQLSTLLEAVPADTGVNIELKHVGMADDILAAASGVDNQILYSSFSGEALRELGELDEDLALAYIFRDSPEINLSIAADIGCVAVNPSVELVFGSDIVENAHSDGFDVNVWTVDDAETAAALRETGVDGLIVDRWDIF